MAIAPERLKQGDKVAIIAPARSLSMISEAGRRAWENMMTILDTCRKNGVSFYHYLKDIFSKEYVMPRLSELVLVNSKSVTTTY